MSNAHTHFKKPCRFKIYHQTQDHFCKTLKWCLFEKVSFGILDTKVLRIVL